MSWSHHLRSGGCVGRRRDARGERSPQRRSEEDPLKRTVALSAIAAVGATTLAVALTPASGAAVHPGAIKFGVPRVVDPIHVYGEPDIKVAPNGTMYVSGPQGTGVQRSIWNVSYDNADSYRLGQDKKNGQASHNPF